MARFTKVATPLLLIMSVSPTLADEGASGLYGHDIRDDRQVLAKSGCVCRRCWTC